MSGATQKIMFSQTAQYYDLIYSTLKDYAAESEQIAELIRAEQPGARSVLDVACGTAEHARLLAERHGFEVDGLDLEPAFVRIARAKLRSGSVYEGDMVSFSVPRRYEVVLCLFSSVGYVRTLQNVRRSFERFRDHLVEGGIMIVEPWFAPDAFIPGRYSVDTAVGEGVTVCRMSHSEADGAISRIRFEYLIGTPSGIERASEIHELGLFTNDELLRCFADAGLRAEFDPVGIFGRGLYIARRA
jgi:SAM-dependent methyltransferase